VSRLQAGLLCWFWFYALKGQLTSAPGIVRRIKAGKAHSALKGQVKKKAKGKRIKVGRLVGCRRVKVELVSDSWQITCSIKKAKRQKVKA
jgi:hypothetical protein